MFLLSLTWFSPGPCRPPARRRRLVACRFLAGIGPAPSTRSRTTQRARPRPSRLAAWAYTVPTGRPALASCPCPSPTSNRGASTAALALPSRSGAGSAGTFAAACGVAALAGGVGAARAESGPRPVSTAARCVGNRWSRHAGRLRVAGSVSRWPRCSGGPRCQRWPRCQRAGAVRAPRPPAPTQPRREGKAADRGAAARALPGPAGDARIFTCCRRSATTASARSPCSCWPSAATPCSTRCLHRALVPRLPARLAAVHPADHPDRSGST